MRHGLVLLLSLVVACGGTPPGGASGSPDPTAAAEQARTFRTNGTRNDWGNYGQQFTRFCEVHFGFDCNREGRDPEDSTTSAEQVQQWVAERNNPVSVFQDLSILFIPQAEQVEILADYEPPNVDLLPDHLHGPGWVTTFVGVPSFLANVDVLDDRGLEVPETWEELADPAYEGLVGMGRVGIGGSGTWAFVAMNAAAGGTVDNWQPGIEYGRRLLPNITQQATLDTFSRGEVPIVVRYDFNQATWLDDLRQQGINFRHVIPQDGSVYAHNTLVMNRYDTAHHDFAKMFMEWVLTDEAQIIFARYGGRPIRSVTGDDPLVVPDEARNNWLPDEDYANVVDVDWREVDSDAIREMWENQVVGGG